MTDLLGPSWALDLLALIGALCCLTTLTLLVALVVDAWRDRRQPVARPRLHLVVNDEDWRRHDTTGGAS